MTITLSAEHSNNSLQDEQGPEELVLTAPEHNFPVVLWSSAFF